MNAGIVVETRDGVCWITIDYPKRKNALDRARMKALADSILAAGDDEAARVVVIGGAGGSFSTGADLTEAQGELPKAGSAKRERDPADQQDTEYNRVIRAIWNLPKPVVGAVDGIAAGFGCALALACDIRLASAKARFALIFVKRGLALDGGASFFLPRLAGISGLEMALTGDVLGAEEALRLGLVNRVLPEAEFDSYVKTYAERMAANAPLALAAIKQAVHQSMNGTLDETLRDEVATVRRLVRTEDVHEGIASFLEKRPPAFKGR